MITSVYADGGVIGVNPSPIGGTWAYCHVDENNIRVAISSGVVLPRQSCPLITNNLTELIALVKCLEALPDDWSGHVYSDSKITLGRMFEGWAVNGIPPILLKQMHAVKLRLRLDRSEYTLLDGHPTKAQLLAGRGKRGNLVSEHNVWCDKRCGEEARNHV